MKMTYKLFTWKIKDKYIAVFPEIDVAMIAWGSDKEDVKMDIAKKAAERLKTIDKMPENKSVAELMPILEELPEEDLISVAGVLFEANQ
jgi:hypothetical protein